MPASGTEQLDGRVERPGGPAPAEGLDVIYKRVSLDEVRVASHIFMPQPIYRLTEAEFERIKSGNTKAVSLLLTFVTTGIGTVFVWLGQVITDRLAGKPFTWNRAETWALVATFGVALIGALVVRFRRNSYSLTIKKIEAYFASSQGDQESNTPK